MEQEARRCRVCGCTDDDCHQCIEKTGEPCHWVAADLCSACADECEEEGGFIYDDEYEESDCDDDFYEDEDELPGDYDEEDPHEAYD